MFTRILVPTDFSPRSLRAARAAARVAATSGGRTTLLHVIERIEGGDSSALSAFYRKLEKAARTRMQSFVAPFASKNLPVAAEVLYGKPVNEILRYAERSGTDLIVMSSHKLPLRGAAESFGTLSYKIGILSRCPVLLVK